MTFPELQLSKNEAKPATHSNTPQSNTAPGGGGGLRTDTLADSLFIMLSLMVMQRLVGFFRAILFCRWLDPEQLGQWDMAFGFLMLAAPLAVLALPGTFGRYAERYRQRGQLRGFIKRTATLCAILAVVAVVVVWVARGWLSQQIFGTPEQTELMAMLAVGLLVVIVYNYFISLFTALRNIRLVSAMQMLNVLAFAGLGIVLLLGWRCTAAAAVVAYAGAALVALLPVVWWSTRVLANLRDESLPTAQSSLWTTLIPFAGWILIINLLTNLFEIVDRYMIVHYGSTLASESLAMVGNYHSSRVMPLLLTSVAAMLATVLTPHLSRDWEAGRRERVTAQLNLFIKVMAFGLTALAVVVMFVAPLLFGVAFKDKFAEGLAVLPWSLTYCIWFSLAMVAQKYLWCAEKAGLVGAALGIGLVVNIVLNLLLLPRMGLLGAVLATSAANLLALVLILMFNWLLGFRLDRGTWALLAAPLALCLGPWVSLLLLLAIALEAFNTDRLLSPAEKRQLSDVCSSYLERFTILQKVLRKTNG